MMPTHFNAMSKTCVIRSSLLTIVNPMPRALIRAGRTDSFRFQKLLQGIPIDIPIVCVVVQARVGSGSVGG